MKKLFLFVMLFVSITLSATDVIVLTNSTRVDAKILEVSSTEIKYRKANSPDGPVFVLRVSEISAIIYENGEVQSFNQPAQNNRAVNQGRRESYQNTQNEQSNNEPVREPKERKIHFNPQPSDNYWFAFTLGYVMRKNQMSEDGMSAKGSFLLGRQNHSTPAMRFGMTMNPTFKYGIGLRTGLFLEYSREKVSGEYDYILDFEDVDATITANDITLSIPLQISYRYEIIKDLSVMFYTGPIFDFGAYQNVRLNGYVDGRGNTDYKSGNLYGKKYFDKYVGFNCLWGIGAAVQWKRLRLDLGGDFGIRNKGIDYEYDDDVSIKWNKPFYITLSLML